MTKIIQRGFSFKEKKNSSICICQEGDKRFWGVGSEGIAAISRRSGRHQSLTWKQCVIPLEEALKWIPGSLRPLTFEGIVSTFGFLDRVVVSLSDVTSDPEIWNFISVRGL